MIQQVADMVVKILSKPNSAFEEISVNSRYYFIPAVIIFAIAIGFDLYTALVDSPPIMTDSNYALYAVMSLIEAVSAPLLAIAVVFYVGRVLGGTKSFKKTFSILSWCFIPIIICITIVLLSGIHFPGNFIADENAEQDLLLDDKFVEEQIILNLIVWPFVIWYIILTTKAIKVMNGFGTKKSFAILILSLITLYTVAVMLDMGTMMSLNMI